VNHVLARATFALRALVTKKSWIVVTNDCADSVRRQK
jgi:hypothetical protein